MPSSHALAVCHRESRTTVRAVAVATAIRVALPLLFAIASVGCTRTASRPDTHARATDQQAMCCEQLGGPARDQCLRELPRADDPRVAQTITNQETYACVAELFVCNPATGRATPASAQAQHDCLEDLE